MASTRLVVMHNFWYPMTHQLETAMFMKNITMLGGSPTSSGQHRGNRFACGPVYRNDGGHPTPGSGRLPGGGCVLLIPGKDGLQW
jgi:hypothetical protein